MHGPHYETSRWCAVVACSSSGVLVECERGIERSSSGGTQQQQRWSFVLLLACSGGGGGGGCCGGVAAAVVVFCVWWWCVKEVVVVIMSFCVPHWASRGFTPEDDGMPSNEYLELEGKGDITRYKRNQLSQFATVPDQYTVELPWTTDGHVDMQGQNNKGNKSQWQTNYNSNWNNGQETEDGVTPSKPPTLKDSTLEAVVSAPPSEAPSAPVANAQDDEMVSWLQYPLDDTLEKTYCSDFFGELRKSDMPLQGISDSFSGGHARAQRMPHHGSAGNDTVVNRNASAEAAMLMGAGRAAGLLPQNGAEAFSKVRTLQPAQQPNPSKSWQFHNSMSAQGLSARSTTSRIAPTPMLPPKSQPISDGHLSGHSRLGTMNFSHFSRPAALVNANLHSLALNSTPPPAARIKPQLGKPVVEASASSGSSIAESTTTGRSKMESQRDAQVQLGSTETEHQNGVGDSRWPVLPSSVSRKETRDVSEEGLMKSTSKPVDQDACHLSSVTGSALPNSSEKVGSQRTQLPDAQEPTITSSSGGSGTSAQRAKEAATSTKRKSRENEDADCHSEEGEEESVDLKKQQQPAPGRGSTAKRSRAAEVHNLSERRRRDRINEKMKALQELIPNSNKTDKASMLDEAIEYLKMLQLQLQMMSMRSGMSLPPMVMPQAIQHPMQMSQMSQMTGIPQMAMGMMGMQGMIGMSMMDLGQPAQGRPVAPMLSHGGPSHDGSVSSSLNPADGHDPRLHTSSAMETINACLPHQHQSMQMPPAMNLEMYNAYVLQQHQHQHHHHHHQTPNMGWGPPQ